MTYKHSKITVKSILTNATYAKAHCAITLRDSTFGAAFVYVEAIADAAAIIGETLAVHRHRKQVNH